MSWKSATELIGLPVVTSSGHQVGSLEDLLIEPQTGSVWGSLVVNLDDHPIRLVTLPVEELGFTASGARLKLTDRGYELLTTPDLSMRSNPGDASAPPWLSSQHSSICH